jgi:hypothetical protein
VTSTSGSKVGRETSGIQHILTNSLDTLIVWTEPDGVDYALSFQDPDGCSEVWNFILEVQRHLNGQGTAAIDPMLVS